MFDDIPDHAKGQAEMLESILSECCSGLTNQNAVYADLRARLMAEPELKTLLPDFVLRCRTLGRSKIGDAHGHGKKGPRPADRHAKLAVNLAGSMASFVIETYLDKKEREKAA